MPNGGKLTIETGNAHLDEIYAAASPRSRAGQYVLVAVSDTGSGMSREVDRRKRSSRSSPPRMPATAPGSAFRRSMASSSRSGGHVKIYSEVGQGTTVKIYLPRLLTAKDDIEVEVQQSEPPKGDREELVLVVEDDDDVRTYSTELMRDLGYQVIDASNGAAAMRLLEQYSNVRLLFTDVGLPGGMNGRQLADVAMKVRPALQVLFTTGYARNAIVHGGRLDPGLHLITKPYTRQALATKVREVLDAVPPPTAEPTLPTGPARILVVEDEVLVRMVAVDVLREAGLQVEEAASAIEALALMGTNGERFAAAILDFGLPDRSADQLAGELRALRSDLPLVIASGYAEADLRQRFPTLDAIAFVSKPYGAEALRRALRGLGVRVAGAA